MRILDNDNLKLPNWNKAQTYTFAFGEALIIPIIYKNPYYAKYLISNEKMKKEKKEPKYKLTNNELDYLLIRKDSKGVFQERVIRIIPDENYLIKSDGRKKVIAYDGLMIVNDWQGKIVDGYKYINGKVVSKLNASKQTRGVLDYICETIDWYSCASGDGGESWYCSYSYSETYCYDVGGGGGNNEDYPDPTFNGGGDNNTGYTGGGTISDEAYSPGQRPLNTFSSKCDGINDLWNISLNSGNEVNGVLTLDGHFLVTEISGPTGGTFNGIYKYGGQVYYFFPIDGGPAPTYQGTLISGNKYFIPIKASIHSHTPCMNDGTDGITNNYSQDDQNFANNYPSINHYVVGCGSIGQFSANSNGYFNIQSGNIYQICNSVN